MCDMRKVVVREMVWRCSDCEQLFEPTTSFEARRVCPVCASIIDSWIDVEDRELLELATKRPEHKD